MPKVSVCDIKSLVSISEARDTIYADALRGMRTAVEDFKKYVDAGDHAQAVGVMLNVSENAYAMAHGLGSIITQRALYEYEVAGGKRPTGPTEALALAARLFPSGGGKVDPATLAKEDLALGVKPEVASSPTSSALN